MIRKVLSFEIREVKDRVLEFVGSTEDKDRMGDVITASGWQLKNYKKNPVFLWAHQYDTPPVGKAVKVWLDNDRLKFHIQFATPEEYEFADTIYKLYKGGYLRATSVGFMPIEKEPIDKDGEDTFMRPTRFIKQELLELSACPVPANPNALAEARAKGLMGDEILHEIEDTEVDLTESATEAHEEDVRIEDADKSIEKPYPNEHACRLRNPDDFKDGSFRRMTRKHNGKEYGVIMGKFKGENKMTEQAYRYDKEDWSQAEAKSHCKEHDGKFEAAEDSKEDFTLGETREVIADEIDYLKTLLKEGELNEENIKAMWQLVEEFTRLSGDIPVEIAGKLREVLIVAPPAPELDVAAIIAETVGQVIAQARGITYGGKK